MWFLHVLSFCQCGKSFYCAMILVFQVKPLPLPTPPQLQGWNLRPWKRPRLVWKLRPEPWRHTDFFPNVMSMSRAKGLLFMTKDLFSRWFYHVLNSLVVPQHWFLLFGGSSPLWVLALLELSCCLLGQRNHLVTQQFRVLGSNTCIQQSDSDLIFASILHPLFLRFFETIAILNFEPFDCWQLTSCPLTIKNYTSRRSSCKSLQAKGPVKVEGIAVKAQRSLPLPWHCSCRPWSFATAVCCWAVGVPVRSLGALPGF